MNSIQLGRIALEQTELDQAGDYFRYALDRALVAEQRWKYGVSLAQLGNLYLRRAQQSAHGEGTTHYVDEAKTYYRKALEISEELGNRRGRGVNLTQLGHIAHLLGQHDDAESLYRDGLNLLMEINDTLNLVERALDFGTFLIDTGRMQSGDCDLLASVVNMLANMEVDSVGHARLVAEDLCGHEPGHVMYLASAGRS
jgi:tetratricopeptide (TPR) repeat protein